MKIVKIGDQEWTSENLNVDRYQKLYYKNNKGSHCIGLCGQVGWFGILYNENLLKIFFCVVETKIILNDSQYKS
jgi:hypothetical protein